MGSVSPFAKLWKYNKSWRLSAMRASTFSFLNKLFDIAPEILIGVAVDLVVKKDESFIATLGFTSPQSQLLVLGVATFIIWASESLFEYLYSIGWRNLAQEVQHALRIEGFSKSVSNDLEWFESESSGNFQTILGEDVNQLERFLDGGINEIIQIIVSTVLVSAVFFYLSPVIAIVALIPVPLIFLGSLYFQKKLEPRYKVVREASSLISRHLSGVFSGIMTVKSFSMEAAEIDKLSGVSKSYLEKNSAAIKISSAFTPIIRLFVLSGFMFTLVYGGFLTFEGSLEAGAYSVLVFLTQRLLWPFTRLGQTVDLFQRARASTDRIMQLVSLKPKVEFSDKNATLPESKSISFEGVSFSYGQINVIDGLDLSINEGEYVGIVGATGSGKSTLLKLLLGYYQAREGVVRIGGSNVSKLDSSALRSMISFVGQDVFLFDGSLRDNICYGSQNVGEDKIRNVLSLTKLDELVAQLDKGLETPVGERGVMLSGGQRQRVSIARAILKDAPIFVFDEATSAVDNDTERFIKQSIESLMGKKTIISVAHRLSSIRGADRIVVMESGEISESGTHENLISKKGLYSKLWEIQTGD